MRRSRGVVLSVLVTGAAASGAVPAAAATDVVSGRLTPDEAFAGAGASAMLRQSGDGTWHGLLRAHGLPEGEYVWGIREATDFDGDGTPDFALFYAACSFRTTPAGSGGCAGNPYHSRPLESGQVVDLYRQTPSGGGYSLTFAASGALY